MKKVKMLNFGEILMNSHQKVLKFYTVALNDP